MRQLLQNNRSGTMSLTDVPVPGISDSQMLVRTCASLVSVGTEKHVLEFAQKNLLAKALARPDLVRQVMVKAQTEGLEEAWRQSMARLDAPVPVGYSSAGIVLEVGASVENFRAGDRVACTGSEFAAHAEIAAVPANLCARLPENLSFEEGAFGALGGIALEAIRMARVSIGSTTAVIGLGLLGQLTVQLLKAAGCYVVGMDIDAEKAQMALRSGAAAAATTSEQLKTLMPRAGSSAGFDSVIIMAATPSNEPLEQAAEVCRERGCIVATGLVGLDVPRRTFYDKELQLVISRAWGPGLYDPQYTREGVEYPLPYARWTAQRNVEEFLRQAAAGAVSLSELVTHRIPFDQSLKAYELILEGKERYLGVVLNYPTDTEIAASDTIWIRPESRIASKTAASAGKDEDEQIVGFGVIGAGLFANGTMFPILKKLQDVRLRAVASSGGLKAQQAAAKFSFDYCTSDYRRLLDDPEVSLIFVLTRHGSHAALAAEAIAAGKHVFVEKPLALTPEQLRTVLEAIQAAPGKPPLLMVGFNRRFSPFSQWLKQKFTAVKEPLAIQCVVNAGTVPPGSWVHNETEGGGRAIGEICHFIDLIHFFTGSLTLRVNAEPLRSSRYLPTDNLLITLQLEDGSAASITYVSGGDKAHPRERIELYGGGAVGVIDNFRSAKFVHGGRVAKKGNWFAVDRGHQKEVETLMAAIRHDSPPPVSLEDYIRTTLATFAIEESLKRSEPVEIPPTFASPR